MCMSVYIYMYIPDIYKTHPLCHHRGAVANDGLQERIAQVEPSARPVRTRERMGHSENINNVTKQMLLNMLLNKC